MYQGNSIATLAQLRLITGNQTWTFDEEAVVNDLMGFAHMSGFNLNEDNGLFAAQYFLKSDNQTQLTELTRLAQLYRQTKTLELLKQPVPKSTDTFVPEPFVDVDLAFRGYCQDHDLVIIDTLQRGISSTRRCSWVYLVWDVDGIVKVFKQVLDYNRGALAGKANREDEIYSRLLRNKHLPTYYGVVDVGGIPFAKYSFHFGHNLSKYLKEGEKLPKDSVDWIIRGVADALDFLHQNSIVYLDVKTENVLVEAEQVKLLDLGISRLVKGNEEIDVYLADPYYGTPEVGTRLKASKASDIYQLGILYHQLLYGKHPFELFPFVADSNTHRESAVLRYLWPTTVLGKDGLNTGTLVDVMLNVNPSERPSASDVVTELKPSISYFIFPKSHFSRRKRENNTVLFTARMGLPHKGYIDYITRLLHLGFFVCISIEHAFTITTRDPIQKSLVMKILAKTLINEGFSPGVDFDFIFTPLYETDAELINHFEQWPGIDDVVAVASGNPQVQALFKNWGIFDQKSVFGVEGEAWINRSWGESLRRAVRNDDQASFKRLAVSGFEQILSLQQLKAMYGKPHIEFTRTVETVILQSGVVICKNIVDTYISPDESASLSLSKVLAKDVIITDLYAKDTVLTIDGQEHLLMYIETRFDEKALHESIYYELM